MDVPRQANPKRLRPLAPHCTWRSNSSEMRGLTIFHEGLRTQAGSICTSQNKKPKFWCILVGVVLLPPQAERQPDGMHPAVFCSCRLGQQRQDPADALTMRPGCVNKRTAPAASPAKRMVAATAPLY